MYGDFSRRPSERGKQFKGVSMQQGRVQLDADWNAQQDLHHHREETEAIDVIGRTGTPKPGGFAITAAGAQITIGAGRYYVEGRLLENVAARALADQPFALGATAPAQDGDYLAYLDVFERTVSAIEDPLIREVALGGPDTTVRTQVCWQVRFRQLAANAGRAGADAALSTLRATRTGAMSARALPVVAQDRPCLVPAEARYRRLDNLLYRVEVQRAPNGNEVGATFKWSRDNGSVVSEVRTINGATLGLAETARDDLVRFEQGAWVEVIDDRMELNDGVGVLRRIAAPVDHDRREITLDQAVPGLPADPRSTRCRVRLWNQEGNVPDGVPFTNDWIAVEAGVEVRFAAGSYGPGDYWLIPARAALGGPDGIAREQTGDIEWPQNAGVPTPEPRRGIHHYYASLAVVRRAAGAWTVLDDARLLFPPLTAITARDVSYDNTTSQLVAVNVQEAIDALAARDADGGDCTVVIRQGDDIAARLTEIPGGMNGRVCFLPGRHVLTATIELAGRGHLIFTGTGPSTVLTAAGQETVLRFLGCGSVAVRDLEIDSGIGQGDERRGLRGAIHVEDTADVVIERVRVVTRSQTSPQTTGITVHRARSARITGSQILVGDQQHGILLVDVGRSVVDDNWLAASPDAQRPDWDVRRSDRYVLARIQKRMLVNARLGPAPDDGQRWTTVERDGFTVSFLTPNALRRHWSRLITAAPPRTPFTSARALLEHLEALALRLLRGRGVVGTHRELRGWFRDLFRDEQVAGAKAITIGGTVAAEVRVTRNRVDNFAAGVHVGLSNRKVASAEPWIVRQMWIEDNALRLWLNGDAVRDAFGIFVGNCQSLRLNGNHVVYQQRVGPLGDLVEGIRVYGVLGPFASVRANEIFGSEHGIRFVPANATLPERAQWRVTDNVSDARQVARYGDPDNDIPVQAIEARVHGDAENIRV